MNNDRFFNAAVRCGSFQELQTQLERLQKSMPKRCRVASFRDLPHASDGVNYWRAMPATGTRFKKNLLDVTGAQLIYWSEARPQSLVMDALDILLDINLAENEEIDLRCCLDCSYEILRTAAAGKLIVRPYVRMARVAPADREKAYVPAVLQDVHEFEEEIAFALDYADGRKADLPVRSGDSLVGVLRQTPVLCLTNRPSVTWESFREIFGPAFRRAVKQTDRMAMEFTFTTTVECCGERYEQFRSLQDVFDRTFVRYGYEKGYDPLVALGEAKLSEAFAVRFPLLHNTLVTSAADIELQIDGLLDTSGQYGLELICTHRKRFDEILESTGFPWIVGSNAVDRWKVLG